MSDNITLPREVVQEALEALERSVATCFSEYDHREVLSDPKHFVNQAIFALRTRLAAPRPEPESKTPAWWMDGLTVTLMREGVNKHRAREIAVGYWEAYCQIPEIEEDKT